MDVTYPQDDDDSEYCLMDGPSLQAFRDFLSSLFGLHTQEQVGDFGTVRLDMGEQYVLLSVHGMEAGTSLRFDIEYPTDFDATRLDTAWMILGNRDGDDRLVVSFGPGDMVCYAHRKPPSSRDTWLQRATNWLRRRASNIPLT